MFSQAPLFPVGSLEFCILHIQHCPSCPSDHASPHHIVGEAPRNCRRASTSFPEVPPPALDGANAPFPSPSGRRGLVHASDAGLGEDVACSIEPPSRLGDRGRRAPMGGAYSCATSPPPPVRASLCSSRGCP